MTLFDSSWTAGVDSDEEQFDDDDYSMSSDESEESEGEYDKIDKNKLAEILQEAPAQTAGVENSGNTGAHEVEENEEEEQSLSDDSNEEGDENTQQEEDDPSSTLHKLEGGEEEIIFGEELQKSYIPSDDNSQQQDKQSLSPGLCQSLRERVPNQQYKNYNLHLQTLSKDQIEEYGRDAAKVIGLFMAHFNKIMDSLDDKQAYSLIQRYSLKQGLKHFGNKGRQAVIKELRQLNNRK
eukprot:15359679-Ditylum_brightwellii.AAC.1